MSFVGSSKIVKVRKPHKCFSCFREFGNGKQMDKWSGVYDGVWNSGYTCLTCHEIHNHKSIREDFYEGIPEGFVHECLEKDQTPEMYLEYLNETIKN